MHALTEKPSASTSLSEKKVEEEKKAAEDVKKAAEEKKVEEEKKATETAGSTTSPDKGKVGGLDKHEYKAMHASPEKPSTSTSLPEKKVEEEKKATANAGDEPMSVEQQHHLLESFLL